MQKKSLIAGIITVLTIYILLSLKLINRPIVENDEGIYWATFLLVNKGYKLYQEISFSQLPGFFLAVYPKFKLLGSTIVMARFAVFFWSTLALLSIVWLGYIRKNLLFSFVTILLASSIPVFFNQSITLQSDIVAASFSAISFMFMIIFSTSSNNKWRYIWLAFSSLFFSVALLTKFDYTLVLPYVILASDRAKARKRAQNLNNDSGVAPKLITPQNNKQNFFYTMFLFSITSLVIIFITLNLFGIKNILGSVFELREKAIDIYPFEPFALLGYLKGEILLFVLIVINILFTFFRWKRDKFSISLFLWFISSLFLVVSFRPLFQHHLVFLVIPTVLLFSNHIFSMNASINRLIEAIVVLVVLTTFINNFYRVNEKQNSRSIEKREIAKNFILKYSQKNDFIITDEAALYGMTERLSPPELADLSLVQIQTQNISKEKFKQIILKYEPKMILVWNGRLNQMKGFKEALFDYKEINYSNGKKVFMLENFYKN